MGERLVADKWGQQSRKPESSPGERLIDSLRPELVRAVDKFPNEVWPDHVESWLADWLGDGDQLEETLGRVKAFIAQMGLGDLMETRKGSTLLSMVGSGAVAVGEEMMVGFAFRHPCDERIDKMMRFPSWEMIIPALEAGSAYMGNCMHVTAMAMEGFSQLGFNSAMAFTKNSLHPTLVVSKPGQDVEEQLGEWWGVEIDYGLGGLLTGAKRCSSCLVKEHWLEDFATQQVTINKVFPGKGIQVVPEWGIFSGGLDSNLIRLMDLWSLARCLRMEQEKQKPGMLRASRVIMPILIRELQRCVEERNGIDLSDDEVEGGEMRVSPMVANLLVGEWRTKK